MPGQCTFLLLVACPSPTRALNAFYKPLSGDHTGQDGVLQLLCFSHIKHLECLRNCIAASLCTNFIRFSSGNVFQTVCTMNNTESTDLRSTLIDLNHLFASVCITMF